MSIMSVIPNTYKLPLIHLLELDLPMPAKSEPIYRPTALAAPANVLPRLSDVVSQNAPQMRIAHPQPTSSIISYQSPVSRNGNGFTSPILLPSYNDRLGALCAAASSKRTQLEPAYFVGSALPSAQPVSPSLKTEDENMLSIKSSPNGSSGVVHLEEEDSDCSSMHASGALIHGGPYQSTDSTTKPMKVWKPRKKRQCPECHLFFSNLATHKSTHLKLTLRPHICEFCSRGFARPNDLFRHVKRHWKETGRDMGQFKCPFKIRGSSDDRCCHHTGIFSRCDTYKNHLKAIHFQYPAGTRKDQRNKVAGSCRACRQSFTNVDDWMTTHVEKHMCPYAKEPEKE